MAAPIHRSRPGGFALRPASHGERRVALALYRSAEAGRWETIWH